MIQGNKNEQNWKKKNINKSNTWILRLMLSFFDYTDLIAQLIH